MVDGKIRNQNHITDTRALRFLHTAFPPEWVSREMSPDYGIDIDLELFGYENGKCITLGEHVFLQIKGTDHTKPLWRKQVSEKEPLRKKPSLSQSFP